MGIFASIHEFQKLRLLFPLLVQYEPAGYQLAQVKKLSLFFPEAGLRDKGWQP